MAKKKAPSSKKGGSKSAGSGRTSPYVIRAREKQVQALQLRKEGRTFAEIAKELGYAGGQGAHEAVLRAIEELPKEKAEELRQLMRARLEGLVEIHYLRAQAGDTFSAQVVLNIFKSLRELDGLDAPKRIDAKVDTQPVAGVLVVPGLMDEEAWVKAAAQQQAALAEKEEAVLKRGPTAVN